MLRPILAAAALACASASPALAYDVATSSSGADLHWDVDEVDFTLAMEESERPVVEAAAAAWQGGFGSARAMVVGVAAGVVAPAPHTLDHVNTVRWLTSKDDPDREVGLLGKTFVEYEASTGVIVDTDVVLDAVDFAWTTDMARCGDAYDVESAVTHEFGHALGLAHAVGHPEATMYATADACEDKKRDLAGDDVAAIAELYPATAASGGGCASGGGGGGAVAAALVAAMVLAAARRRARATGGARAAAGVAGVALIGLAGTASAAQLRRLGSDELAARARLVVRGHVVSIEAVRDARGEIETDAIVVVDDCLAGGCARTVAVRRHGGELGDAGLRVDGEAELVEGQDVVLYLRVDGDGHARVLGGVQGAWRVDGDDAVRDLRAQDVATEAGFAAGEREVVPVAQLASEARALTRQPGRHPGTR